MQHLLLPDAFHGWVVNNLLNGGYSGALQKILKYVQY